MENEFAQRKAVEGLKKPRRIQEQNSISGMDIRGASDTAEDEAMIQREWSGLYTMPLQTGKTALPLNCAQEASSRGD